jgi:uncharacterized protein
MATGPCSTSAPVPVSQFFICTCICWEGEPCSGHRGEGQLRRICVSSLTVQFKQLQWRVDVYSNLGAALKPAGLQRTVLLLAITKPARLYVSRPILTEYDTVLAWRALRIRKGLRQQLLQLTKNHSYIVTPSRRLEVTRDPDDNFFLECADAASADYLVTGNQRDFPRFWKKTKVITPQEFIDLAAPHLIR